MVKSFAIIGLGRFGYSVAITLAQMGHEVLAIDEDEKKVEDIINYVTHAVTADARDEQSLQEIGIRNFDVVVVAIGQDIEASILVTVMLKEMGVVRIVSKAQNEIHGKVLERVGAEKVVFPERDMGEKLARALVSKNILEQINLSPKYSIVELKVPDEIVNKTLQEADIRRILGVTILAIRRDDDIIVSPGAQTKLIEGDVLVAIGLNNKLSKLEKL